jgi:hypothetical protein
MDMMRMLTITEDEEDVWSEEKLSIKKHTMSKNLPTKYITKTKNR